MYHSQAIAAQQLENAGSPEGEAEEEAGEAEPEADSDAEVAEAADGEDGLDDDVEDEEPKRKRRRRRRKRIVLQVCHKAFQCKILVWSARGIPGCQHEICIAHACRIYHAKMRS